MPPVQKVSQMRSTWLRISPVSMCVSLFFNAEARGCRGDRLWATVPRFGWCEWVRAEGGVFGCGLMGTDTAVLHNWTRVYMILVVGFGDKRIIVK